MNLVRTSKNTLINIKKTFFMQPENLQFFTILVYHQFFKKTSLLEILKKN